MNLKPDSEVLEKRSRVTCDLNQKYRQLTSERNAGTDSNTTMRLSFLSEALGTNDDSMRYLRAKRSKSAIWRSISSRAESAAERMPWMRSWNSSGFVERSSASSRVMSCLV